MGWVLSVKENRSKIWISRWYGRHLRGPAIKIHIQISEKPFKFIISNEKVPLLRSIGYRRVHLADLPEGLFAAISSEKAADEILKARDLIDVLFKECALKGAIFELNGNGLMVNIPVGEPAESVARLNQVAAELAKRFS
jgi:hypothetical protein